MARSSSPDIPASTVMFSSAAFEGWAFVTGSAVRPACRFALIETNKAPNERNKATDEINRWPCETTNENMGMIRQEARQAQKTPGNFAGSSRLPEFSRAFG